MRIDRDTLSDIAFVIGALVVVLLIAACLIRTQGGQDYEMDGCGIGVTGCGWCSGG